jgi:hypothetical protein
MSQGTGEHLEHAEHAAHHAHDPFDRKVAMTMAIVAAVLACVTLLSHRAHTETLRLQGEANRLKSEANIFHTRASDQWSYFQANNIRNHAYQAYLELLPVWAKAPGTETQRKKLEQDWTEKVKQYTETKLPKMQREAESLVEQAKETQENAEHRLNESEQVHHRADRYDLGELAVEIALVLCAISLLTKNWRFWYAGMAICAVGAVIALTGYFELFIAS